MKMIRQGDVLLVQSVIPKKADKIEIKNKIILAEGEATGHTHAIKDLKNAALFADKINNKIYLMVFNPVKLEHEEHKEITIPMGEYQVIRQREYHPKAISTVLD